MFLISRKAQDGFFLIFLMGEITAKRAKGDKVKVLFQGL
jgi:hypothetical protein